MRASAETLSQILSQVHHTQEVPLTAMHICIKCTYAFQESLGARLLQDNGAAAEPEKN